MALIYFALALTIAGIAAWIIHTYMAVTINAVLTIVLIVIVVGAFLFKIDFGRFEDV